jgi:hypothetical protein
MGLFDFFKKPDKYIDEYFGPLHFVGSRDASQDYFEGKTFFNPGHNEVTIIVKAGKNGPTSEQHQFYKQFQENYDHYVAKIQPLIIDEFRNWRDDFEISDFLKEFKLVFLVIPNMRDTPLVWEMAFTTIHDLDHHVTINFLDDQPNGILIDG